jgi:hypothetical protein
VGKYTGGGNATVGGMCGGVNPWEFLPVPQYILSNSVLTFFEPISYLKNCFENKLFGVCLFSLCVGTIFSVMYTLHTFVTSLSCLLRVHKYTVELDGSLMDYLFIIQSTVRWCLTLIPFFSLCIPVKHLKTGNVNLFSLYISLYIPVNISLNYSKIRPHSIILPNKKVLLNVGNHDWNIKSNFHTITACIKLTAPNYIW